MQVHAITCPQCGASLPVNDGDTFVICSHCGTRSVLEYTPAETAAFMPTRFIDLQTGLTAFTARIPQGWRPQGAIQPNNVMDNWVTVTGSATSANGYEKILFESMCTYRFIKGDPAQRGWAEPMYSAQDLRLFWRYHTADDYADEIAMQIAGGAQPILEKRMALPGKVGEMWRSQKTYQAMYQAEQQVAAQFAAATGGLAAIELQGLELTTSLSLYRLPSQAGDRAIILATIVKAIEATKTGGLPGAIGGAGAIGQGIGALIGGLLGQRGAHGQSAQQGSFPQTAFGNPQTGFGMSAGSHMGENYIEWKPTYYLMLTEWPVTQGSLDKFSTFVDSVDLDPSILQVAKQYSDQFDAQLASVTRANDERWERVSQFARQQSADLDRWRSENWNRMQDHDRQMARIRGMSNIPSSFGGGETIDDRVQRLRHESMMDVNTYEREDGSTYEFSTQADRAFENDYDPRTHVGTEGYYDDYVPDGWTEGHRKL